MFVELIQISLPHQFCCDTTKFHGFTNNFWWFTMTAMTVWWCLHLEKTVSDEGQSTRFTKACLWLSGSFIIGYNLTDYLENLTVNDRFVNERVQHFIYQMMYLQTVNCVWKKKILGRHSDDISFKICRGSPLCTLRNGCL